MTAQECQSCAGDSPKHARIRPEMPVRKLLRVDLIAAMKDRDAGKVSLIRTLIAAIENAEAVDPTEFGGVTEVPRLHLSDDEIMRIILDEGDDLRRAASEYTRRGHVAESQRLLSLSKVADRYAATFDKNRS